MIADRKGVFQSQSGEVLAIIAPARLQAPGGGSIRALHAIVDKLRLLAATCMPPGSAGSDHTRAWKRRGVHASTADPRACSIARRPRRSRTRWSRGAAGAKICFRSAAFFSPRCRPRRLLLLLPSPLSGCPSCQGPMHVIGRLTALQILDAEIRKVNIHDSS